MVSYNSFSPYYATKITNDYLDILNLRDIPNLSDDILFTLTKTYEYRPDLLAFDLYNDQRLWWVFSLRNKDTIRDPVFDMIAGTQIYLPKLSVIKKALGI
jgi:hypothetical protein